MDKTTEDRIVTDAYRKYNLPSEGGQRIGYQEGATAEIERLQPVIDALAQFIARHEGGLLPDRFTYEKGVKALEQWKGAGKEE